MLHQAFVGVDNYSRMCIVIVLKFVEFSRETPSLCLVQLFTGNDEHGNSTNSTQQQVHSQYANSISESSHTQPRGSKRRFSSPDSDFAPPPKKKQASSFSRIKKSCYYKDASSKEVPSEFCEVSEAGPSLQQNSMVASSGQRSFLEWTFVKKPRRRGKQSFPEQECLRSMPASTCIPRVWTNVRLVPDHV
jgi:hypothetical protein